MKTQNKNGKSKFVIEKIAIPEAKMKKLNSELRPLISTKYRSRMIRDYVGGTCIICYDVPSKIVRYDMDGAQLVDRYCEKCLDKADLDKRLQNMNFA